MILAVSRCVSSLELSALRRYFFLCEFLRGHRVLTGGQVVVSSNLATPTKEIQTPSLNTKAFVL